MNQITVDNLLELSDDRILSLRNKLNTNDDCWDIERISKARKRYVSNMYVGDGLYTIASKITLEYLVKIIQSLSTKLTMESDGSFWNVSSVVNNVTKTTRNEELVIGLWLIYKGLIEEDID